MSFRRRSFLAALPLLTANPAYRAVGPRSEGLEHRLVAAFDAMEIADTHEHFLPESERVSRPVDFFTLLSHYAIQDLVQAGMPPEAKRSALNQDATDVDRWQAIAPYWKYARFTGFSQALRISVRDIYGIEDISLSTIRSINEVIRARNKPGLYRHILKDRARIRFYVQDDRSVVPTRPEPESFVIAREFDQFVVPATPTDIQELGQLVGLSITSLDGLRAALEKNFAQAMQAGMAAVKTLLAYNREILFHEVAKSDAARDFDTLIRGARKLPEGFRSELNRPFRKMEDYMFHELIKLAVAHGVPVQIHTGANMQGFIANANPTLLTNLFRLYPRVKFDLFHIGYPFFHEISELAKFFPNVYLDFCWAHVLSAHVCCEALHEYLDMVPANKILAFGGDYLYPELSYAHAKIARRNVARVLATKTEEGFCSEDEALELGRVLLHDSASALFRPRSSESD